MFYVVYCFAWAWFMCKLIKWTILIIKWMLS